MKRQTKTKEHLINELAEMRQRIAELEKADTERKRAEEELRESGARNRAILDAIPDLVFQISKDGTFLSYKAERFAGLALPPSEFLGKKVYETMPPEFAKQVMRCIKRALQKGDIQFLDYQLPVPLPNGDLRDFEARFVAINEDEVVVIVRDITERKRSEEELRESEEKYRALFDSALDGVAIIDAETMKIVLINQTALKMYGFDSAEDIAELNMLDYIHPDDRERAIRIIAEDMFEKDLRRISEFRTITKDGQERWLSAVGTKIEYQGKPAGLVSFMDITERKRAEEKIEHLNTVLRAIRNVNQLITREKDSKRLIKGACVELVETRGYFNAWIALLDESGRLVSTAEAGLGKDFKPIVEMLKRGELTDCGRRALKQSGVIIIEDPPSTCVDCPLAQKYSDRGAMTARLEYGGKVHGLMSVSIPRDLTADEEEQTLFREVAGDIAQALHNMKLEEERKLAEEALEESEEFSTGLLDNSPTPILVINPDTSVRYVNPALEKLTGFSNTELVNQKSPYPWWTEETLEKTSKDLEEAMSRGVKGLEEPFQKKNGERFWVAITSRPVRKQGELDYCLANWIDITERKQAEEALRQSEMELDTLIRTMPGLVFYKDTNDRIIRCNDMFVNTLGLTYEEVLGKTTEDLYPQQAEDMKRDDREVIESVQPKVGIIEPFTTPEGTRWAQTSKVPIRDVYGKVIGLLGITIDITERKRAEEALRESEEKLRILFDSITDAVVAVDLEGYVVEANEAAARMIGYGNKEDFIGQNVLDSIAKKDRAAITEDMAKTLEEGQVLGVRSYKLTAADGREFNAEFSTAVLRDSSGNIIRFIGVARDITERKLAEEERERSAKRVQALHFITQAVSHSMDMDEMLNQSLDRVLEVMDTKVGGVYLLDLQAGEFTLRAQNGVSEEFVSSVGLIKLEQEEIKRGLECQELFFELERVFTEDNVARIAAAIEKDGLRAYTMVPLWSRGVPLGALVVADRRERQFSADELDLLSAIGNEIAVGIENATLLERTRELSITDELTGLHNRRHFYQTLESEQYRTKRYGRSFSLAMLDLDGFKEYNDRFGHTSGDGVLQSFAQTLKSALRKSDISFRYGGDEFTVILPATDTNRAKQIIDRTRAKWLQTAEAQYPAVEPPLGFSAGIAQFPEDAETGDGLVFLADSALYFAKREGGYRAVLVSDLSAIPPDVLSAATLDQVYALAATVDARDPFTYGHSGRVAEITQTIGKTIGLAEKELADLYAASLLHDVGKVGVPDSVLTKPDVLTEEEWEIIKKHSAEGARIAGFIKGLGAVVPVILHHHEWYDGTGYPDGLKGEEIPLGARIISVADAYDTMTTARLYREVVSQQEALEELRRCPGTQFDPELVEAFCRAMTEDKGKVKKRKPSSK